MSAASGPIDRTDLAQFRASDERAFERIVRHEFADLSAAARLEAGDDASATRVVEDAFMNAWTARERFDSPESLAAFLRDAVHRGALRERGRRAALHRFEEREQVNVIHRDASGAPATADEVWNRVNTVLHTPRPSAESTARIRADVSRHEAAAHVARVARGQQSTTSYGTMAAVAVVVIAAIAAMAMFLQPGDNIVRYDTALAATDARVRATGPGQQAVVELTDASRVALAPATRLRIPAEYGDRMRVVGLEGAAGFEVAADGAPFHVRAGAATVRVTGTKFDVAAWPGEETVTIRVREGTVDVTAGETTRTLQAGDAVSVGADGTITTPGARDVDQAVGFANGELVIEDRPLREVVPLLNRWYALDLNVSDARLLERRASVRAPLTSSKQAIEDVERSAGVRFGYVGENKVLRDTTEAR